MRWTIFALGVLLLAGFASAISAIDDCDASMVAYWQMEGNAMDSFGTHHGDPSSYPSVTASDVFVGKAAGFDGTQMIEIDDSDNALSLAGGGGFAIEFWFRSASSPNAYLLNKGNYQIRWVDDDGGFTGHIEATVGTNGPVTISSALSSLNAEVGYHVVLTWLPAAQNLSLYINNILENSTILDNPDTSTLPLEIGEDFVGLIDEVALYSRAFSAADVKFHWQTSGGGRDYCYLGGSGDVSTTKTEFTLAGCQLPESAGGGSISAGSCSRNGMYYCEEVSLELYETFYDGTGCSFGASTYVNGNPQCCPSGYLCKDDPDDEEGELPVCNLRTVECGTILEQGLCDAAGCFWVDDTVGCVGNPSDYSCSIYRSNASCQLDVWNVGSAGMGTAVCGTYFVVDNQGYVIPQDSCKCDWTHDTLTEGNYCMLGYDVMPDIYGDNPSTFRCQKDFSSGDCIDGKQHVNWTAGGVNPTGDFLTDETKYAAVLLAAGCTTDLIGIQRDCGEPIVKLPGFSLFALMSSLGIIGLVYFFKRE
ncbi:MAG: LamG domain-containing protein [Nanoarchaeota archaeon]|nr:LamG domain-containing protein [Nanoarchaeota archaeon]